MVPLAKLKIRFVGGGGVCLCLLLNSILKVPLRLNFLAVSFEMKNEVTFRPLVSLSEEE